MCNILRVEKNRFSGSLNQSFTFFSDSNDECIAIRPVSCIVTVVYVLGVGSDAARARFVMLSTEHATVV